MVHGRLDQGCGSGSIAWANIMTLVLGMVLDREKEGSPAANLAHLAFTAGTSAMRVGDPSSLFSIRWKR